MLFISVCRKFAGDLWLLQVAERTFGVPAPLANRIAAYSDNESKQLQLDRRCNAIKRQRRLGAHHKNIRRTTLDYVLLNKAAIVLPPCTSIGKLLACQLH